ncbi:major facilitator superfamily domain-containing protein [Helicostylum pulchrum]|uniref:Major facilitator superfamily (MFS) profile domain-containing protein n=1 Tax=Helicostylum pulchrum TaxID=562976 RepID=A0ABP9YFK3_9FUNG|nr:major facilitator superfamily domain-containing protein [Helicostylum pulchrum]
MDEKPIKYIENESCTSSLEEQKHIENAPFVKSEAEKRLVRKLNMRLLPLALLIVFLQFVDKSSLSIAVVLGILDDTNMSYPDFNVLSSLFYIGFFVFQIPNNYFLQKYPVGKYMGVLVICWGAVTIGTAFGKNFTQLAVLRILLGLFEAGSYPGIILIFNTMYRRSEQPACFGFLYACNGIASVIGSSCSVGIAKMGTVFGIKAWQWGYIIWGTITVVAGVIIFFFLIDSPDSWFLNLTEEEKLIVEARTRDNAVVRKQKIVVSQYWEALKEPRCWIFFFAAIVHNLQNGGMLAYGTVLVQGLGFTAIEAIILQIPAGALSASFVFMSIYVNYKSKQMVYTAVIFYCVSGIGCLLLAVLPHNGLKLLGYYLSYAQTASYATMIAIIGSTVSGYSKKIFYNGVFMLGYTIGNFGGPLMLADSTRPEFIPTIWGWFAGNIFSILCLLTIRIILGRINKKRAPDRELEPTDVYLNLTDKQDKNYVYSL